MHKAYSKTVSQIIAAQEQRYAYPSEDSADPSTQPRIIHQNFTVTNEEVALQAPAWSDYVGRILDVSVSRTQLANGFRGQIDTYVLKDMIYLDSRTDPVTQARTAARISKDGVRDYVFHVAVEGIIETVTGSFSKRKSAQFVPGILALDMNQTMYMVRPAYAKVLAFFLPRAMVESAIPDAESIHGRVVAYTSPLTRLILNHLLALCHRLPMMDEVEAEHTIQTCAHLIIAAFSKQVRLSDTARNVAHVAVRAEVQRYIQGNLYRNDLSPEAVQQVFQLPRATLYRMFEHEGGLGTYIRNCRLREAAHDLARFPQMAIIEIAYGLSFNSASDFTRAFRRSYGMTPLDFRALALDIGTFDSAP